MLFIWIVALVVGIAVIYGFVKGINAIFNPMIQKLEKKNDKLTGKDNPYIQAHLMRRQNDEMYEEYLNWLDRTGGDLPIDKIKTKEEQRFEQKFNNS